MVMILGAGTMSLVFFWAALLGLKPSAAIIAISFQCSFGIIAVQSARGVIPKVVMPGKWRGYDLLFLAAAALLLLFAFSVVAGNSLLMPLYDVDAYRVWGLKAKALYHEGLADGGLFHQPPLSYSQLNYPLLVPFLMAGTYAAAGEINEFTGRLVFPCFYVACTLFLYSSLRWRLDRSRSLLLTLLFMSLPATIRWAGTVTSDFPMAVFFAPSAFYLCRYIAEEKRQDLALAVLSAVFCSFVKQEGVASAFVCMIVFFVCHPLLPFSAAKLKTCAAYAFLVLALMVPWFLWYRGIRQPYEGYPLRIMDIFSAEKLARGGEIVRIFIKHAFAFDRWGLLWLLAPAAAIFSMRSLRSRFVVAMWLMLAARLALYFVSFIVSPWSPEFHTRMALERILLHAAPAAVYILAFHLAALEKNQRETKLPRAADN